MIPAILNISALPCKLVAIFLLISPITASDTQDQPDDEQEEVEPEMSWQEAHCAPLHYKFRVAL